MGRLSTTACTYLPASAIQAMFDRLDTNNLFAAPFAWRW